MSKMTNEELKTIIENHKKWLESKNKYEDISLRANLVWADLNGADLNGVNLFRACLEGAEFFKADLRMANFEMANLCSARLMGADLRGAQLRGAQLRGADLRGAQLVGADLSRADLRGADLGGADLRGADLGGADLRGAYLRGAHLFGADLRRGVILSGTETETEILNKYFPIACPEYGQFIGWKKAANNYIVKLQIPEDAKRSSAFGRKCRCNKALVLDIQDIDGTSSGLNEVSSIRNKTFIYRIGDMVEVTDFDENRFNACSTGIHFFVTREEAVRY